MIILLCKSKKISLVIGKEYLFLRNKLIYVIDLFENIYVIKKPIRIIYGSNEKGEINITPGKVGAFFEKKIEIPSYTLQNWNHKKIPFLFFQPSRNEIELISSECDQKSINLLLSITLLLLTLAKFKTLLLLRNIVSLGVLYIILYICAVEIAPFLWLLIGLNC